MSHILSILNEIEATSSTLAMQAILEKNSGDVLLKKVFHAAYDPSISYYITGGEVTGAHALPALDLEEAIGILHTEFASRLVTGNRAKDRLTEVLNNLPEDDAIVIQRILGRDLRVGMGTTITNKVWKGLIPTFDFLLADTDPSNIVYPAISQLKADGIRCAMHVDGERNVVTCMSRQGKPIEVFDFFNQEGLNITLGQTADLDGELICYENDEPMSRKVSNGILNKAIKGTISREEASKIRFIVWDVNEPDGIHGYQDRFLALEKMIAEFIPKRIILIETKLVDTEAEALAHFKEIRRRGLEGTIVKNLAGKWVPKRSKDLCKFKAEVEAEFRVVGYELGTGKNKDRIGKLNVESEDGLVKTGVGIFKDFDEKVRDEWLVEMPPVVTILYNERITDKSRKDGTESLFLPRVTAARWDKTTANTRDEMIAIEKAILS